MRLVSCASKFRKHDEVRSTRPALAASLEINLENAISHRAVTTIGTFYRPQIQVIMATACELSLRNLGALAGRSYLHLYDPAQRDALDMWEIFEPIRAKAVEAPVGGCT